MKIFFLLFYIDEVVINEVVDLLCFGWIIFGLKVKVLEEEIKFFLGVKEVFCVNFWILGVIMMLCWLGVKEGDEVIVFVYIYSVMVLVVFYVGVKLVMVDFGIDFNILVEVVCKVIIFKIKVIIFVDIVGFFCDYERIMVLV